MLVQIKQGIFAKEVIVIAEFYYNGKFKRKKMSILTRITLRNMF